MAGTRRMNPGDDHPAIVNAMLLRRDLRALWRERDTLAARLGYDALARNQVWMPGSPVRLAALCGVLWPIEAAATATALQFAPMRLPMVMGARTMLMTVAPILPLPIVQALVALALGMVLWLLERRVGALRQRVATLRRLLAAIRIPLADAPLATGHASRLPTLWHGFRIFSRPPPFAGVVR